MGRHNSLETRDRFKVAAIGLLAVVVVSLIALIIGSI